MIPIEIRPGGVVATAVQQHEITGTHAGQRTHHRVKIDCAPCTIVVGILEQLQPGSTDQRDMIGPGRGADPDPGFGARTADELRTDT